MAHSITLIANRELVFTVCRNARTASAVLAMAFPSVCPSDCLLHAGIVSKRLHVECSTVPGSTRTICASVQRVLGCATPRRVLVRQLAWCRLSKVDSASDVSAAPLPAQRHHYVPSPLLCTTAEG